MRTRTIFLSMLAALVTGSLWAAEKVTVKLKDGTTIEGVVVSETDEEITIKAAGLKLAVDKEDIAEIKRPEKPETPEAAAEKPADGGETAPAREPKDGPDEAQPPPDEGDPKAGGINDELRARIDGLVKQLYLTRSNDPEAPESHPDLIAAGKLRQIKGPGVNRYLLSLFEKASGKAKLHLAVILAERKENKTLPTIASAIEHAGVNETPPALIKVLGQYHTEPATAILLKHLPKARGRALDNVLKALYEADDVRVLPGVMPYLEHPSGRARGLARLSVIRYGKKVAAMEKPPFDLVDICLKRLKKTKYPGEYAMIFTFVGDQRVDAPLVQLLESQNRATLASAIFAVGERRIRDGRSKLLGLLADAEMLWRLRVAAGAALQKIKDMRVVPRLINIAAVEKHPRVRGQIYKTLKGITGQGRMPSSAAAWRKWWREEGSKL